ncbi:PmoA family protein [uncultured Kriegella sp.]|uniref:DUF6807 domain-containing protein n=1 Tax=uncultured Kriegella sp. TaxID=1798910 RepID=UPI0030DAF5E8|tara:strand:+ start:17978 stop:19216 length:1239 start_codon:yes stop_codon:yes gene_type:complete
MGKKHFIFFGLALALVSCAEKETFRFKVHGGEGKTQTVPVALNAQELSGLGWTMDDDLVLLKNQKEIPFQIDKAQKKLWFLHNADSSASYNFEKIEETDVEGETRVAITKNDGNLDISTDGKPVLTYRYGMTYPPKGVDSIFKKSGYIHPVRTPSGDILSRIQPPDHYHHYGIWGPWTHTQIEGQQVDFWNLGDKKGTVLFKEFNQMASGPIFGAFSASQEHIDFLTNEEPQVALNENLEIKVWNLDRPDRYIFDYTTTFSSPLESGILFEAYRYGGGIGMRFTERWHKDNCAVLTSEGNDRLTADGTNARWCIVSGASADGKGTSGILFMSYPDNRSHPEPMRIWPIDGNGGRGDMFFEFCPIRHKEWKIEPNKDYQLKYRMVVFDGKLSADEAEAYWQAFATKKEIEILK